jgi:hypothetical protein
MATRSTDCDEEIERERKQQIVSAKACSADCKLKQAREILISRSSKHDDERAEAC